jgi:hypothetical protein
MLPFVSSAALRSAMGNVPGRHLERTHVLQTEPVRRTAKMAAELRHPMQIGSLFGWRKIAQRHVVDHASAQGAHRRLDFGHREAPDGKAWVLNPLILPGVPVTNRAPLPLQRVRSIPKIPPNSKICQSSANAGVQVVDFKCETASYFE